MFKCKACIPHIRKQPRNTALSIRALPILMIFCVPPVTLDAQPSLYSNQNIEIVTQEVRNSSGIPPAWTVSELIQHSFSIGIDIPISPEFSLSPALINSFSEYIFLPEYDKVFPATKEAPSSAGPLARSWRLGIQIPARFHLSLTADEAFIIAPVLSALFTLPLEALDNSENIEKIAESANSGISWFYTGIEIGLLLRRTHALNFAFIASYDFPIYKAFNADTGGALDRNIIRLGLQIRASLEGNSTNE